MGLTEPIFTESEVRQMLDDLAGDIGARHGDNAGHSVKAFRDRRTRNITYPPPAAPDREEAAKAPVAGANTAGHTDYPNGATWFVPHPRPRK